MNTNIKSAQNKFKFVLIALIIFQILFLFIIHIFFNMFSAELGTNDINFQFVKKIIIIIFFTIFTAIDIFFFFKFIHKYNSMLFIEPRKCIIEDFIFYPYGNRDGTAKKDYRISPLVRDVQSNELYYIYDKYCLSYYNSTSTHMNNYLISKIIFRKDGSKVKIGDTAYVYIKKIIDVNVILDESNNIVHLNNNSMRFKHINEEYTINVFNNITYFEGVVEVEDISL